MSNQNDNGDDSNNNNNNNKPEITSLLELEVAISKEVKSYLESQYSTLYQSKQHNHVGEEENTDEQRAKHHVNRILASMKAAPSTTCCRVNTILSTREEVMKGLDEALLEWRCGLEDGNHNDDKEDSNQAVNQNQGFEMRARAHEMLEDVVMIDSDCSGGASSLPLSSRGPPPSSTPTAVPEEDRLIGMSIEKRNMRVTLGWPDNHRVVICDRMCGEAVLRGSNIFVRGILCADSGVRSNEEVAVYAHLGETTASSDSEDGDLKNKGGNLSRGIIIERYTNRKCVFLGMGITQCHRPEMFNSSHGIGVIMTKLSNLLPSLPKSVLPNKMMLQNLPSILVAHALNPKLMEHILDMCCAPGGKTSHIAALMNNQGLIVACDRSRKKVVKVREMMEGMGASCVVPIALDSTKCVLQTNTTTKVLLPLPEMIHNADKSPKDQLLNIKSFPPNSFDRVLLDPPCSALGLRPKLAVELTLDELHRFGSYQQKFIHNAISLLKPGGVMTYSTCTINAAENEEMVGYILKKYGEVMDLVNIDGVFDGLLCGLPGLGGLTDKQRGMVKRFDPSDEDLDTMGFFVAKFRKKEEGCSS